MPNHKKRFDKKFSTGQPKFGAVKKTAVTTRGRTTTTTYTATKLKRSGGSKTVSKLEGAIVKLLTKAKRSPAGNIKKKTIQVKKKVKTQTLY